MEKTLNVKDLGKCVKSVQVTIDAQTAVNEYNSVLQKYKNYVVVPGFRKGKAPLSKVEVYFGPKLQEEFISEMYEKIYKEIIEDLPFKIIDHGKVVTSDWNKGTEFKVEYHFESFPEVKVEKFENIEVEFEPIEFAEKMIDEDLEKLRNDMKESQEIEEINQLNDTEVELSVRIKNKENGYSNEVKRTLDLSQRQYSETFYNDINGKKINDEFETVLFEKDDSREESIIAKVKVEKIKRNIYPELNDSFASDAGYENMDELKAFIKDEKQMRIDATNLSRKNQAILHALIDNNSFEVPESMVQRVYEEKAESF
ncbi:MAG: trigger factor, partial [Candidatus Cloacimonetes bacterium]|nr:trigger factor [Candidatus Cloacimonadota bacterium]